MDIKPRKIMKDAFEEMAKTYNISWKIRASECLSLEIIGLKEAILEGKAYAQEIPSLRRQKRLTFLLMEDGLKPPFPCFKGKRREALMALMKSSHVALKQIQG